ncbi:spermidine/putrescine ABC transporter permease [Rhizobium sp. Leaf384]|uniref:ABC transporter permease n=1 Tax=unclassified Rhizobium TaxID=2613769 RepID=UPI000713A8B1|nr:MULTISPECIES: ABC transporter permease subunit [unclassified Rhizobium]KQS80872.1 spermidine/putrescine ABC transporter permease [Rhizobium sp. Leaf384]KQS86732.1 spermidine/putrescine ABC transporter permease [Rhizobium sp. Leaf383]
MLGKASARGLVGLLLVALPVSLVGWLVIWPIISAVQRTVWRASPDGAGHFDLSSYVFFFSDAYSLNNLSLTLWTTSVCAALLLVVSLPIALYLRFARGRLASYVQALAILPMFVPSVILAYALIRVLGPNGLIDLLLNAAGLPKLRTPYLTPWGPVIGLVWDNIPLTVLILLSGLGAVGNSAIEAARDVGANRRQRLWHIILPQITTSILVALSFAVLGIFSAFTLPYLLGPASPEMMGPYMQRTFRDLNDPVGAVTQAVVTFGFCIVFGLFYVRSVARNQGK